MVLQSKCNQWEQLPRTGTRLSMSWFWSSQTRFGHPAAKTATVVLSKATGYLAMCYISRGKLAPQDAVHHVLPLFSSNPSSAWHSRHLPAAESVSSVHTTVLAMECPRAKVRKLKSMRLKKWMSTETCGALQCAVSTGRPTLCWACFVHIKSHQIHVRCHLRYDRLWH